MSEAVAQIYEWMAQQSFFGGELVLIGIEFSGTVVRGVYVHKYGDGTHQTTPDFYI